MRVQYRNQTVYLNSNKCQVINDKYIFNLTETFDVIAASLKAAIIPITNYTVTKDIQDQLVVNGHTVRIPEGYATPTSIANYLHSQLQCQGVSVLFSNAQQKFEFRGNNPITLDFTGESSCHMLLGFEPEQYFSSSIVSPKIVRKYHSDIIQVFIEEMNAYVSPFETIPTQSLQHDYVYHIPSRIVFSGGKLLPPKQLKRLTIMFKDSQGNPYTISENIPFYMIVTLLAEEVVMDSCGLQEKNLQYR